MIPGEDLLKRTKRVMLCEMGARGRVVLQRVITVESFRRDGDTLLIKTSGAGLIKLHEWDFRIGGPPRTLAEAPDDDQEKSGSQSAKEQRKQPDASIDAQVNKYIDDLLDRDFDATQFAQELLGLARRADRVLELEKTVIKMGLQKLPDEQRQQAKDALAKNAGVHPEKTSHEEESDIQAPRAGRAGPTG